MAVPKKRTSKSKTALRKNVWKKQAEKHVNAALDYAKVLLKQYSATTEGSKVEQPAGEAQTSSSTSATDNEQTVRFVDWIRGDKAGKQE
uniref:Large ribosomal subunit protein bL32c n=1 Tax=Hafniomonas laevis TaxID=436124 RepID=A0A0S2LNQ9_9CHLO|nr:ribosomal protein L32 [Hafniomonas laevis]ALO63100.1 ribosomal protein L32 [Hafniomonas laevis]